MRFWSFHVHFSPNYQEGPKFSLHLVILHHIYNVQYLVRNRTGYHIHLLNPTGHVMHQQFNIQQLYVLPTLYLCVLYLSENKQQLVPLIS